MPEPALNSWDKRLADILCFELHLQLKLPHEPALFDALILAVYRAVDQRRRERQAAKGRRRPPCKPHGFVIPRGQRKPR